MVQKNENFLLINQTFPHIGKKLAFFWGHPEFNTYVDDLLTERKGVERVGFPPAALKALFDLAQDHEKAYPNLVKKTKDIWHH